MALRGYERIRRRHAIVEGEISAGLIALVVVVAEKAPFVSGLDGVVAHDFRKTGREAPGVVVGANLASRSSGAPTAVPLVIAWVLRYANNRKLFGGKLIRAPGPDF